MKAVYCHNNVYRTDEEGRVYSEGQFDSESWSRYLQVFEALTVVSRVEPLGADEDPARFNLSQRPKVSFRSVQTISRLKHFVTRRPSVAAVLREEIRSSDAVIVRGTSEIVQLAARLALSTGKPIAAEVVGCAWESLWHYGTWRAKLYAPIAYLRTRRMISRVPFAIYVTREFLQRRYPCPGYTEAASNVQIDPPDSDVLERRLERIGEPRDLFTLGLIGTLDHEMKGIDVALEALAETREILPPVELRILGPGNPEPWQSLARQLGVASLVHFDGTLESGDPVLNWLDQVDIYLQPSLTEGLPRATIEAMSRGCPVVASSAGGLTELLDEEDLHRPGDHRDLADRLVRAVTDTEWQRDAARRNFRVSQRYTSDVLEARRNSFWQAFADYASSRGATN